MRLASWGRRFVRSSGISFPSSHLSLNGIASDIARETVAEQFPISRRRNTPQQGMQLGSPNGVISAGDTFLREDDLPQLAGTGTR